MLHAYLLGQSKTSPNYSELCWPSNCPSSTQYPDHPVRPPSAESRPRAGVLAGLHDSGACYKHQDLSDMDFLRHFTAKPYPPSEGLSLLWRGLSGADRRNPGKVEFAPRQAVLNEITPHLTLGFGGDVMSMFDKPLQVGPSVRDFFAGCDHVMLNFEGIITDKRRYNPDQKHTVRILEALAQFAPPERTVLSMANNHTGDFGEAECRRCLALLNERGFTTFGLGEQPFIDLGDHLRIVTGTWWSNRDGQHLAWLKDPLAHVRAGAFNVLFPHWGYELELYPRLPQVRTMQRWLESFDAVLGHHSHTPQPITMLPSLQGLKVAAYSLGDLCFGMAYKGMPGLKYFPYGIIARLTIGPRVDSPDQWATGELTWSFIDCDHRSKQDGFVIDTVEHIPFFPADFKAA